MQETELSNIPITDLIPQSRPFVMVDKLIYFDRVKTVSDFKVREDNIFISDSQLSAFGLIENVAQTCAARMGYINYTSNNSIKLGFIGAIKDFNVNRLPEIDETLQTSIVVKEEIFNMTLVEANVMSGGEVLASANMKIALSDIDRQTNLNSL